MTILTLRRPRKKKILCDDVSDEKKIGQLFL